MTEYIKYYNTEEKASLYLKIENEYVVDIARDKIYADHYGHSVTRNLTSKHIAEVDDIMEYDENMSKIGNVDEKEWLEAKIQFLKIKNKESEIRKNIKMKKEKANVTPKDLLEEKQRKLEFKKKKRHKGEDEEEYSKKEYKRRTDMAKKLMQKKMNCSTR